MGSWGDGGSVFFGSANSWLSHPKAALTSLKIPFYSEKSDGSPYPPISPSPHQANLSRTDQPCQSWGRKSIEFFPIFGKKRIKSPPRLGDLGGVTIDYRIQSKTGLNTDKTWNLNQLNPRTLPHHSHLMQSFGSLRSFGSPYSACMSL